MKIERLDINSFITFLEDSLENGGPVTLLPSTRFKEIEEWTSLQSLIVIAGIADNYKVSIMSEDLQQIETVHQFHKLVITKM